MKTTPLFLVKKLPKPCLPVLFACLGAVHGAETADKIFRNGAIVAMDAQDRTVEAVAVRAGKVLLAGSEVEVKKLAGPTTTVVDLKGRVLLPGFYAAHDHFPSAGMVALYSTDLNSPPIGKMESIEDIVAVLRAKAEQTPKGEWVTGRGYDDTLLREQRHPTRADLDRASTNHPIWIGHVSGHLGAANSRALAIAHITKDTPQPKAGVIRRDRVTGEPNGVFEESGSLVSKHIPGLSLEDRLKTIGWCDHHYLSKGVTTTVIAGDSRTSIQNLSTARDRGLLHLRVVAMLSGGTGVPASPGEAAKFSTDSNLIHIGAIKLFQDGSLQGLTGYLTAPYHQQPEGKTDYCGYAKQSRESLAEKVGKYHRAGYQIAIHANGDAAIDDVLFAYAEAQRENPRPDARHRIEHCQTPRPDQLARMKQLGVSPSFFEAHVFYWGDRHRDIFLGPERAARISPLASALNQGLHFTLHNDTPVTPVDPMLCVWAAVNRVTRNSQVLGPAERISVRDALRAVTIEAAWQNFEETRKGSIEPGRLADFVVLAENPMTVPPERLKDIAVLETFVGGESVYRK